MVVHAKGASPFSGRPWRLVGASTGGEKPAVFPSLLTTQRGMHAQPTALTAPSETPLRAADPAPLGVYVHFPWCLQKCPYCDFLSVRSERETIPHTDYANAVIAELTRRSPWVGPRPVSSVFFGGGTPSLWTPSELGRVLRALRHQFPFADDVEVTVE